ncbi:type II toxin-antitoxin system ParD family antitoxin [Accumulibacter sp.]|uniref:type II toxin-antitoxin system ParD family antitoxin n=1 Tax=Accumulibacter sp. TaxID=2053492 RepID=UPI00159AF5CF|nr:type II toxin-antitoxin system ParD family antitoxin [Accumulibacter sp.]QKS28761.1 MAG: type II toxin-antitoxin system ParD family antitoxin [Candidatus Accumulibacter similis]
MTWRHLALCCWSAIPRRHNNAGEVVREGLRLLEDQEKLRALKLEALPAEMQRGIIRRRLDASPAGCQASVFFTVETPTRNKFTL